MPDPTADPLRLGVHGLGAVAQTVHLPLIERHPDRFRVTAVCDLSASVRDAVGERWAVPPAARHATLDAMLAAGGLDGLVILTPASHADAVVAGLDAGLAVLCEKPLAYSLVEIDRVDDALARSGGRLLLGYMKLADPAVVEAHDTIDTGDLGPLRAAEVTVLHPTAESQLAFAHLPPPSVDIDPVMITAAQAATDSVCRSALGSEAALTLGPLYTDVLLGSIVHDLAVLRYLVGDPVSIDHAATWPAGAHPPSVAVSGGFAGGARLSLGWHYLPEYPTYREEVRLHFEGGSVELLFPVPYRLHLPTRLTVRRGGRETVREHRFASVEEAFEQQLLAFERLARQGTPPPAGIADARIDIVTCQRIAARLAEGQGLRIGGEAALTVRASETTPV